MTTKELTIGATEQPSLWSLNLIGQTSLWQNMLLSINSGKFPHLSLLSGRPGNVQLPLALALSQAILCDEIQKPCGICNSCKQVYKLIHPDVHFSFPLSKAKETCQEFYSKWRTAVQANPFMSISDWFSYFEEESKNANIPVSEVQNIISLLHLKPFASDRKVLIIWLPEYLGKESNRLLKLFEEPPEKTFIILVTENPDLLLSTVQSRAQRFQLLAITYEEASDYINRMYSIPLAEAHSAVVSSEGNMHEALAFINNKATHQIEKLQQLLQSTYQYQANEMVNWVDHFSKLSREDQKYFLIWMQRILSFVLRLKYIHTDTSNQVTTELMQYIKKLTVALSLEQIEKINILLDDILMSIQRNANVKILMTDFCIQLAHITRAKLN
ncbi:MAG: hypothetical protein IPM92_01670 [Saprospiraceae bacterium]|nr:hypothetical protein [Saprospiraceae bacterium]